jgi:hypothetical protein
MSIGCQVREGSWRRELDFAGRGKSTRGARRPSSEPVSIRPHDGAADRHPSSIEIRLTALEKSGLIG